jgi:hypothetical protein
LIFVKLPLRIDYVILPLTQPHEQCEREGAELANIIWTSRARIPTKGSAVVARVIKNNFKF